MWRRGLARALALGAVALLIGLGVWQIERRVWKLTLIDQVERRLAAAPVAAPGPARWPAIGRDDAYARVRTAGRWRRNADSFVQAVTDLGGGFWVVTPLDTDAGWPLLVNRGFVPAEARAALAPPPTGRVAVTGLLRVTEPGGAFLRSNRPAEDRWYSRDVAALAARRGVTGAAPYFIDADRLGAGWPRGGLTVVRFPNNHLIYALTWFALAGMIAFLSWRAGRRPPAP